MSVIYPGNYVASLNAYRGQGVFALPVSSSIKQSALLLCLPTKLVAAL